MNAANLLGRDEFNEVAAALGARRRPRSLQLDVPFSSLACVAPQVLHSACFLGIAPLQNLVVVVQMVAVVIVAVGSILVRRDSLRRCCGACLC
jgi:hypothetical protein